MMIEAEVYMYMSMHTYRYDTAKQAGHGLWSCAFRMFCLTVTMILCQQGSESSDSYNNHLKGKKTADMNTLLTEYNV